MAENTAPKKTGVATTTPSATGMANASDESKPVEVQSTPSATKEAEVATGEQKRRGLSAESRLKLAMNDVLGFIADASKTGTPLTEEAVSASVEVATANTLLTELGFVTRTSSAKRIQELQDELRSVDVTAADSQTRINAISKELGKLRKI